MTPRAARLALCCFAAAPAAGAQSAVIKHDANLRHGPATSYAHIRQLHPNDEVEVLAGPVTGYDSVRTALGEEGWVYANFVHVLGGAAGATDQPAVVYRGCQPEGTAVQDFRQAANRLKNRVTTPAAADIDPAITLAAILAPNDDRTRWQPTQAAEITGLVVNVKRGSSETVNCGDTAKQYQDTHIEMALAAGDAATRRVIVEVTPRWRAYMAAHGVKWWATDSLKARLKGHQVTITGWMFFDNEHADEAENTAPGVAADWRATAWEVHPVTKIVVH